jgi:ABC-type multidrug transport system fused ATPase/permease subunit
LRGRGLLGIMAEKKKRPSLSTAWLDAKELIWAHRYRLALGLVLIQVNRIVGLVLAASSKYLIDEAIIKRRSGLLLTLALAVGTATLIKAVSSFAPLQVLGLAAQRAITETRKSVQEHIARLPVSYFDSTQKGVLISRIMTDAEGIRNLLGTGLVQLVSNLITASIALCVLFYLNWRMTLITLFALAIFGACTSLAFSRLRPLFRERGQINAEVTGRLAESLAGIRIVKAYSAEKGEELVFARGAHRLFRNVARAMIGVSGVTEFSTIIVGGISVILMVVGGRSVLAGQMTLGDFFMYALFTWLVASSLVDIASIGTQITEAFAGLDRIREIKRMATEDADDADREPLGQIEGEISFEDVSFEYNEEVPVLKHVSFNAPAGSTTALVGSSGSGKSTLISLVMAFNRPLSGRVNVDGRDLASIRLRDYRTQLGVVLQDNFLFDGTIAENISFAHPQATREQIIEASRIAHCEEFINGFADDYDTIVGERGVKLSGGQGQRVAIARAILAEPKILILDEATSSLDSESEAMIQDGLQSLRQGRTTFVIAHRLSTIRSADQILVFERGEIMERGTHEDLLLMDGRYKQLYDTQYKFEHNQFINPGEDFTTEPPKALASSVPVTDSSLQ